MISCVQCHGHIWVSRDVPSPCFEWCLIKTDIKLRCCVLWEIRGCCRKECHESLGCEMRRDWAGYSTGLFFQPLCGNTGEWIFRNLEFSRKLLEFSQKTPWVKPTILEFISGIFFNTSLERRRVSKLRELEFYSLEFVVFSLSFEVFPLRFWKF